jgi:hypothetical protein
MKASVRDKETTAEAAPASVSPSRATVSATSTTSDTVSSLRRRVDDDAATLVMFTSSSASDEDAATSPTHTPELDALPLQGSFSDFKCHVSRLRHVSRQVYLV